MRLSIPKNLEKDLLQMFGQPTVGEEGHVREYTEQVICEQLRKLTR